MPTKRGPARKSNAIKRKHRFRKKHTHHVTPVRMKELLEEAKALLEEWLINYDEVEVQVLADLESKLVVDLQEIEDKLDHATWGLAALKALIVAVEGKLDHGTHGLAALKAWIDAIETKLDHATWGLAALKALLDALEAKLDVPANFMADVSALALEATLSTHDTDIKALLATIAGYIDTEIAAIIADIGVFPTANYATLAAYVEDIRTRLIAIVGDTNELQTDWADGGRLDLLLDKLLTGIIQGTGTVLPVNKSLYDLLWLDRYDDEQDSFLWDTSAYTTNETDISALFATALTGTKRRKYMVYLDMTGPAGDAAAWTKCTVKVKVKIDGANYRTIAKAEKTKTDLAATAEPGIPIEVPMGAKDVQITMQFDVALATDKTIYYHRVEEKMEY